LILVLKVLKKEGWSCQRRAWCREKEVKKKPRLFSSPRRICCCCCCCCRRRLRAPPLQRESTHPSLTTTLDFQKTKKCGERERDKKEKTQNLKQTHQHLDLRDVNRAHRYISVSVSLLCVFSIWVKTLSVSLYLLSPPSLSLLLLWIFFFLSPLWSRRSSCLSLRFACAFAFWIV